MGDTDVEFRVERSRAGHGSEDPAIDHDEVLEAQRNVRHELTAVDENAVADERMLSIEGDRRIRRHSLSDGDQVAGDWQVDRVAPVAVAYVRHDLEGRSRRR